MKKKENINKENFFDRMMGKYPGATQGFCDWIDAYKQEVGMDKWQWQEDKDYHQKTRSIKFHDLPIEMQKGIIQRFIKDLLNQDMINFTTEGLMADFERLLEHIQDRINLKNLNQDK